MNLPEYKLLLLGICVLGLLVYSFESHGVFKIHTFWNNSNLSATNLRLFQIFKKPGQSLQLNQINHSREDGKSELLTNDPYSSQKLDECENISHNVTETSRQKCLFYNMVPKCGSGGTRKLIRALKGKLNYTSADGNYHFQGRLQHFQHSFNDTKILIEDMRQRCNNSEKKYLYYRHQFFDPFSFRDPDYVTPNHFNLVRDPVNHYISWYYYRRYGRVGATSLNPKGKHKMIQKNMTFEECVLTNYVECSSSLYTNNMVPYFCGNHDSCSVPSMYSLNTAKRNVIKYFQVVGYLENYFQFLELCEYFWPQFFKGATNLYLQKEKEKTNIENTSPERHKNEPSEKIKEIMKARMPKDYIFYNWIKQRFHCLYKKHIISDRIYP